MPKKTVLPSGEIIWSSDNSPEINPESLLTNTSKPTLRTKEGIDFGITLYGSISNTTLKGSLVNFKVDQLNKRIVLQFKTEDKQGLIAFTCALEKALDVALEFDGQSYICQRPYYTVYFEMPGVNDILELVLEEKS